MDAHGTFAAVDTVSPREEGVQVNRVCDFLERIRRAHRRDHEGKLLHPAQPPMRSDMVLKVHDHPTVVCPEDQEISGASHACEM